MRTQYIPPTRSEPQVFTPSMTHHLVRTPMTTTHFLLGTRGQSAQKLRLHLKKHSQAETVDGAQICNWCLWITCEMGETHKTLSLLSSWVTYLICNTYNFSYIYIYNSLTHPSPVVRLAHPIGRHHAHGQMLSQDIHAKVLAAGNKCWGHLIVAHLSKKMKLPEAMEKTAHQNWKAAGVESRTSEELSPPSLFWRVSSVQSNPWTVRPPLQIGLAAVKQGPVDSKRGQCFLDSERTNEETDPSNFSGCCTYIECGKNDSVSINSNGISWLSWGIMNVPKVASRSAGTLDAITAGSYHKYAIDLCLLMFVFRCVRFSTQPSQVRLDVLHPLAGHLHRLAIELWHVVACSNLAPWRGQNLRSQAHLFRRWYEDV